MCFFVCMRSDNWDDSWKYKPIIEVDDEETGHRICKAIETRFSDIGKFRWFIDFKVNDPVEAIAYRDVIEIYEKAVSFAKERDWGHARYKVGREDAEFAQYYEYGKKILDAIYQHPIEPEPQPPTRLERKPFEFDLSDVVPWEISTQKVPEKPQEHVDDDECDQTSDADSPQTDIYREIDMMARTITIGTKKIPISQKTVWNYLKDLCDNKKTGQIVHARPPHDDYVPKNCNDMLRPQLKEHSINLKYFIQFAHGGYILHPDVHVKYSSQVRLEYNSERLRDC